MSLLFAAATLAVTGALFWLTSSSNARTDHRLLQQEVQQAASALSNQVPSVQAQMVDAVEVARNTHANPAIFARFVHPKLSTSGPFASMSLWRIGHGAPHEIASAGLPQALVTDHRAAAFLSRVHPSKELFVTQLFQGGPAPRLGYAEMPPGDTSGLVVYAERFLPGARPVKKGEPSLGQFALYLGHRTARSELLETTAPTPLPGAKASAAVPFGDRTLTLVGARTSGLAGTLSTSVPWVVLGAGILGSVADAALVEYVTRRRRLAEHLARRNEELYLSQRRLTVELQEALLPELPEVDGVEIAARYLAGVAGTEVGGDWYDVVPRGEKRCVIVVGDVSGRGLQAAATMASLRFALRAYLAEGYEIGDALGKLRTLLDVDRDRRFATVLVVEIDIPGRRMWVASAGHLLPLVISRGQGDYVRGAVGTPVGVVPHGDGEPIEMELPDAATVVAFSDGLVERPGELLDVGLARLRDVAVAPVSGVDELVDRTVSELVGDNSNDDAVIIGVRWTS